MTTKKPHDPNQLGLFDRRPVPAVPAYAMPAPPPVATPEPSPHPRFTSAVAIPRGIAPRRKRGSPGPQDIEAAKRDEILTMLSEKRATLIDEARAIAIDIAKRHGRVTSVEVFAKMREYGYDDQLDAVDPRFMGCVFREELLWERIGFEHAGSHKRPVSIWKLAGTAGPEDRR